MLIDKNIARFDPLAMVDHDDGLLLKVTVDAGVFSLSLSGYFLTDDFMRVKYAHRKCAGGFYASDI